MKALVLTGVGGPEHLAVAEVPAPEITRPDEVRVRVHAAALNHLDVFVAGGIPGVQYEFPKIVGSDGAGVVESVGRSVTSVRPGARVFLNPAVSCGTCAACAEGEEGLCTRISIMGEHRAGTAAEYVVLPASNVAPVPAEMGWPEAAAFPLATLTAWRMLTTRARLVAGERVLVWGAGGGVAQACIRIAHHLGATVIATSSSDGKLALARRLGAAHVVNHATEDVVAFVKDVTLRRGCDVVVDSVGEKTWPQSLRAIARGGRMVVCGATSGPMVGLDVRRLFWHQWSILGSTMGSHREFREVAALARERWMQPVVDSVVPLAEAASAYRRLAAGEQAGKVVIEVTP